MVVPTIEVPRAVQLGSMLRLEGFKGNQNHPQMGFELAGVSWSELAAGTL